MYVYMLKNPLNNTLIAVGKCNALNVVDKMMSQARRGLGGSVAVRVAVRACWEMGSEVERTFISCSSPEEATAIVTRLRTIYRMPKIPHWTKDTVQVIHK